MRYRTFGRLGWRVGEIGFGMWGMSGWTGSDDVQSRGSLEAAFARGVNFFDTSQSYGNGHSELLLGRLIAAHPDRRLYAATRIPPRAVSLDGPGVPLSVAYPRDYVRRMADVSAANLGVPTIPLLLLDAWEGEWLATGELQLTVAELKRDARIRGFGIALHRDRPESGLWAVESGLVDAVEVAYNVFDQAAADRLMPACGRLGVAVIARSPLDEGALTGNLTLDPSWPTHDPRTAYFSGSKLGESIERAEALRALVPPGGTLAELAIRFVLSNPLVATTVPGMRQAANVVTDTAASDAGPLPEALVTELQSHRWNRLEVVAEA